MNVKFRFTKDKKTEWLWSRFHHLFLHHDSNQMWNSSNAFAATFQLRASACVCVRVHCSTYPLNRVKLSWQQQRNMMLTFTFCFVRSKQEVFQILFLWFYFTFYIFWCVQGPVEISASATLLRIFLPAVPATERHHVDSQRPTIVWHLHQFDYVSGRWWWMKDGERLGGVRGVPPCGGGDKNNKMKKESTWQQQKSANK